MKLRGMDADEMCSGDASEIQKSDFMEATQTSDFMLRFRGVAVREFADEGKRMDPEEKLRAQLPPRPSA